MKRLVLFLVAPILFLSLLLSAQELAKGKDIRPMEGQSLLPAFGNAEPTPRRFFWEHQGNAAVRDGRWKLVRSGAKGEWELYDLVNDPAELDNLAGKLPDRVKKLSAGWNEWARRVGAKPFHRPSSNTDGKLIE